MYEIITKKKQGVELTTDEINAVVNGFTTGEIPKYQMSALLMAICLKGMSTRETTDLTMAMANSGDQLDLSALEGTTVDKHSTGGVGDKTTLIVAPIIAALGLPVAKMSGRGLGHTGGTIDKLEAIPGFRTEFTTEEFLHIVQKHGLCISGQSGNMVPADKKIYALRDVTATVDSIPLIAASIMSKKIAAGAKNILLDVKTGNGAFMKNLRDARELAQAMVNIGKGCGRKTAALVTDMSQPLGRAIGNSLEIREVIDVLSSKKNAPQDLIEICVALAANMLLLSGFGDISVCMAMVEEALQNGAALEKFAEMVAAQGGDRKYIDVPSNFEQAKYIIDVCAEKSGYVCEIDTEGLGIAAMQLGAGRKQAGDTIDYSAGIIMHTKIGSCLEVGDVIATMHTNMPETLDIVTRKVISSLKIAEVKPKIVPLIHELIQ